MQRPVSTTQMPAHPGTGRARFRARPAEDDDDDDDESGEFMSLYSSFKAVYPLVRLPPR